MLVDTGRSHLQYGMRADYIIDMNITACLRKAGCHIWGVASVRFLVPLQPQARKTHQIHRLRDEDGPSWKLLGFSRLVTGLGHRRTPLPLTFLSLFLTQSTPISEEDNTKKYKLYFVEKWEKQNSVSKSFCKLFLSKNKLCKYSII